MFATTLPRRVSSCSSSLSTRALTPWKETKNYTKCIKICSLRDHLNSNQKEQQDQANKQSHAPVGILVAGTSDLYVAEEAQVTLQHCGISSDLYVDIGVAGLHRLLGRLPEIQQHSVLIVVAGMEAALPSVVAGLVSSAVVAVPTSVGYGSHFEGLTALLGMLNACAPGISVVNIDNGYGAAMVVSKVVKRFL